MCLLSGGCPLVSHEAGWSLGMNPKMTSQFHCSGLVPPTFSRVPVTSPQGNFLRLSSNGMSLSLTLSPPHPPPFVAHLRINMHATCVCLCTV